MGDKNESWTTIESDPGVFTQLVELMGVKGVQFEELYSLDKECLDALRPVYGLIFLFKWKKEQDDRKPTEDVPNVFFAKQVIQNACATQAILAVLLNCPKLELGSELASFREFTADFPPEFKGESIGNSDSIRAAHNSFARPEPIISDESTSGKGDAFHFISYVHVDGVLYELDGLKDGPVALGQCTDADWLDKAGPAIQERIERYTASEIRFNLLAVCQDRRVALQQRAAEVQALREAAAARGGTAAAADTAMQVDAAGSDAPSAAAKEAGALKDSELSVSQLDDELARLADQVQGEEQRRREWHDENVRRKHNYIPLIFNLLKLMAEKQQLAPLLAEARKALAAK